MHVLPSPKPIEPLRFACGISQTAIASKSDEVFAFGIDCDGSLEGFTTPSPAKFVSCGDSTGMTIVEPGVYWKGRQCSTFSPDERIVEYARGAF